MCRNVVIDWPQEDILQSVHRSAKCNGEGKER